MPKLSAGRVRPRHAIAPSWRQYVPRISRRAMVIVAAAVVGGPLAYFALPVPSMANPGVVHSATVVAVADPAPVGTPALLAGLILGDDRITDPIGVVTSPPDPSVDGDLIGWPVSDHTPSTGFGYRKDPFTHKQRWHDGVDLGQPCGDPAHASLDGTVAYAGWAGGYGNRIIVRHADRAGHTFATTYNHLSKIEVKVGDQVGRGDVIARIGSTGRSTACHMHFEVILDGSYVDPMRFLTGDQSKAGLSRRVGSYMPSGLPSPANTTTNTNRNAAPKKPSPSPTTPSSSSTPTPTPTSPSPSPAPPPSDTNTPSPSESESRTPEATAAESTTSTPDHDSAPSDTPGAAGSPS